MVDVSTTLRRCKQPAADVVGRRRRRSQATSSQDRTNPSLSYNPLRHIDYNQATLIINQRPTAKWVVEC